MKFKSIAQVIESLIFGRTLAGNVNLDALGSFRVSCNIQEEFDGMKIDPDDMISQAEAARIRGVSHQAIVDLVKRGRLKAVRIGGKVFLRRSE